MQQGGKSQRHSFQVRHIACGVWLYPCSVTGTPELGYLRLVSTPARRCKCTDYVLLDQHFRPFNSEVHSASALLPCSHHSGLKRPLMLGSLEIALKRTRPRQRFCYVEQYSMTEVGRCQEGE